MQTKNSTMKINVIGAGGWGKNIVNTLHELDALGSVTELNENIRNELGQGYPAFTFFNSVENMLASTSGPIVIATPVSTHAALTKQALEAGRDVFVEKPMAMSSQECNMLNMLARQQDRILMVGHMLLYQPAIQFIKQYLQAGDLGKVYSLRQVRRNLGRVRTFENALYSLGVHDLAVLSYLVEQPFVKITAVGQAALNVDIEDEVSVHITYQSGIRAHLNVSWLWPYKERHLTVVCERGTLIYDELNHQVVLHKNYARSNGELVNDGCEILYEGAAQPLKLEMQHFIECVREHKQPLSSARQGKEVINIIEIAQAQLRLAAKGVCDVV